MSHYISVLKPGSDDHLVSNYRPIQLNDQIARLQSAMVADRLLTYCSDPSNPSCQLKYWNLAFQPNKSIDDYLAYLTTDAHIALHKPNTSMDLITADISGAYDSINIDSLMYKLHHNFNLYGRILRWLYNYLTPRWFRLKLASQTGPWCLKLNGLGQGVEPSLILMAMYINDFVASAQKLIQSAAYVDDFFFCTNPTTYLPTPRVPQSTELQPYLYNTSDS